MISERDRGRARAHLGYGQVQQASTFLLGVPAGVETAFMVEATWARILPSAEKMFCDLLDKLDDVETIIFEDTPNVAAKKIGNIELNDGQFAMLLQRYRYWQGAVANMIQVPPNPFDQRPGLGLGYNGAGGGINVPVQNG